MSDAIEIEIWHMVLAGLYLAVAAVFCMETAGENRSARRPRDGWYIAGLACCVVWPLLIAVLLARSLYAWARGRRH